MPPTWVQGSCPGGDGGRVDDDDDDGDDDDDDDDDDGGDDDDDDDGDDGDDTAGISKIKLELFKNKFRKKKNTKFFVGK